MRDIKGNAYPIRPHKTVMCRMYMSGIQGINSNCIPYVRESQIICDNESTILWLFATLAVVLIIPRQLVMDKRRIYI